MFSKAATPADNAAAIRRLLDGEDGPFRDIALLNAAAALVVAGQGAEHRATACAWRKRRSTAAPRFRVLNAR